MLLQPSLVALLIVCAPALHGQGRGSLKLTVVAAEDTRPIAGVEVLVKGVGSVGTTNRLGLLEVGGLPAGTLLVEARFLGYAPWSQPVSVRPGATTELSAELEVEAITLAAVEIAAREPSLARRGFYDRMRLGGGTFLTRERIDAAQPRYLSDLLRGVGGVNIGGGAGGHPAARIRGQQTIVGGCPIQYFVDGVLTTGFNIDDIRPQDVAGIEIYRGAASIPPDFKRGTASCGVIAVWTRVR